jgi:hypothetical protein
MVRTSKAEALVCADVRLMLVLLAGSAGGALVETVAITASAGAGCCSETSRQ